MDKIRNKASMTAFVLLCGVAASLSGFFAQPARAQSMAERERCAESVGIQTRHNGKNSWIKRRVSGKTYSAFLRCTDTIAMKNAETKPRAR
ncbi:hypothetical protein [Methylobacterium aquaticum]|uniref:hypothetical protein n=1 Tax=Methylobacterium aquaticum TaxID=270351 RepID=UPI00193260DA|nr:hypothetical protein [Methylobacterium aquaticum]QRE77562.1 hypothetical protein F1D61_32105 [Methylobacterium aquaticum]